MGLIVPAQNCEIQLKINEAHACVHGDNLQLIRVTEEFAAYYSLAAIGLQGEFVVENEKRDQGRVFEVGDDEKVVVDLLFETEGIRGDVRRVVERDVAEVSEIDISEFDVYGVVGSQHEAVQDGVVDIEEFYAFVGRADQVELVVVRGPVVLVFEKEVVAFQND